LRRSENFLLIKSSEAKSKLSRKKNWRRKMTIKNVGTAKQQSNLKQSQASPKELIVSVNELAKKLGILPKRLRSF
jgi:hypothetical protein